MSYFICRKSTPDDCSGVYELICELEAVRFPYDRFSQIYAGQNSDSRYCCLVCEKDSEIVAVLNLRFENQLHHCSCIAEIIEFVVAAPYRGHGIGKDMFDRAVNAAREAGCTRIELATNQVRKNAHRFYERMGMKHTHYTYTMDICTSRSV